MKRLDNVGIAMRELRRALAFYTETLGLAAAQTGETDALLTLGDSALYLFQTQAQAAPVPRRTIDLYNDPPGIDHVAFEVEDIEQAAAELAARGVIFPGPVVGESGEFRYRGFSDPDGTMLYIVQKPR